MSGGNRGQEALIRRSTRHGWHGTPEHTTWWGMRDRCENPKSTKWERYGARGIKICDRWRGERGFENFLADMGPRPSPLHSLDRINNDGNYEPGNCRWATWREQAANRRNTKWIEIEGERRTAAEWDRKAGLRIGTVARRMRAGRSGTDLLAPTGLQKETDR